MPVLGQSPLIYIWWMFVCLKTLVMVVSKHFVPCKGEYATARLNDISILYVADICLLEFVIIM